MIHHIAFSKLTQPHESNTKNRAFSTPSGSGRLMTGRPPTDRIRGDNRGACSRHRILTAFYRTDLNMDTRDMSVIDLKPFVPTKDSAISRQFYTDLGFKQNWANDQIAEFQVGSFRFLLQPFYVQQHAENFMMHLMVEDADAWWTHIHEVGLAKKYPGIMVKPPEMQPWGLRVLFLSDPTGVLWHIAEHRP